MKSDFVYNPQNYSGHSHAATIANHNGEIYLAWYAYQEKEHEEGQIVYSKYNKETGEWPKAKIAFDYLDRSSCGNPVLFSYNGKLNLLFVILKGVYWDTAEIYHSTLDEETNQWSLADKVNTPIAMMIRHRPLVLNGKCVVPAYDEITMSTVLYEFSTDPTNWTEVSRFSGEYIQGDLVALNNLEWQMYLRAAGNNKHVMKAMSSNAGQSWAMARETPLYCPMSGIAAIILKSSNIVVCNNHTEKHQRFPLSLSISETKGSVFEGKPWDIDKSEIELSYPTMVQDDDGNIHLAYTYNRKMIKHILVSEDEIMQKCKEEV